MVVDRTPIYGECFCGDISYRIDGPLLDARSCHCSRCRKAFSSAASAYALVAPDTFHWTAGEQLLSRYESQQGFGLAFCSRCGSTLCGIFKGAVHGVTLGCINGDPHLQISRHIHVASKAEWDVVPEGVCQYPGGVED